VRSIRIKQLGRVPPRAVVLGVAAMAVALAAGADIAFGRGTVSPLTAGVVVVETTLGYQGGAAAGTGVVLTPSGEVLTNNHVIRGATAIRVVVPNTGRSYQARVLGYDLAADVALLKLQGASGLQTVAVGDSSKVRLGQKVTAVGNAGGTGSLAAAKGTITGRGKTITARDGQGASEQLTGLLETNAPLQPGDSGGPLLNAANRVLGIDTAASAGFFFQSASNDAYAVPINRALAIARQVEAGKASATVHVGNTGFLGVQLQASGGSGDVSSAGALVAGVVTGSPADRAGLVAGNLITAIDGHPVTSLDTVPTLLLRKMPGDKVQLSWADQTGTQQTTSVTLASGPPQ
jgi:S1-C subfamily serine protease